MATSIVHFGPDVCFRLLVFESAGYAVRECRSVDEFEALVRSLEQPDAIVMSETDGFSARTAISLVRLRSAAPCVLFQEELPGDEEPEFDLVVPAFTPPRLWLGEVAALIARSQAIRRHSRRLTAQSAALRREAAEVQEQFRRERDRSQMEAARNADLLNGWAFSEVDEDTPQEPE
jgi:hypothetical protein